MSSCPARVGFIGVGDMGEPIARHIIEAGFPTTLWARRAAGLAPFAGLDFRVASGPADLGRSCDVVGLCVFGDADVREVILGAGGVLEGIAAGGVIVIHATITVETATEIAEICAARGVSVLDAPVSGSRRRSIEGALAIMVGGDEAGFQKALPVMRSYGATIERLGSIGSGQKMKVLNNVLGFCNLRMAYLAIETGEQLGLDRNAIMTMLRASSGNSFNLELLIDRLLPEPAYARHALTMTVKDLGIFQKVCAHAGVARSRLDLIAEEANGVVEALGRRQGP
jgi:3-hydroxyisobutyrate dehydrogenase-like beta-hydroxyacid dehydrogenase